MEENEFFLRLVLRRIVSSICFFNTISFNFGNFFNNSTTPHGLGLYVICTQYYRLNHLSMHFLTMDDDEFLSIWTSTLLNSLFLIILDCLKKSKQIY